jgi:hypothetical protein
MAKGRKNREDEAVDAADGQAVASEAGDAPAAAGPTGGGKEKLSNKMEGMRRALAQLGKNAGTTDIQDYLRDNFGIKMSTKMISSYKSFLAKKKGKRKGKPGRKPKAASSGPAAPAIAVGGDVALKDIRTLKELADRMGPRQFRELVGLLCP